MAYLYRHIRLDKNEPFYIGIGTSKYYSRAYRKNRNNLWHKITDKTNYETEILLDNLTWDDACEKEKEFIKLYGRINLNNGILANLTDGGEGALNFVISDEHRKIVAEANRKRIFTEKDRKNISLRHKGRKHSLETKNKISNALRNSDKFKVANKLNAERYKGFKHSEKTKQNLIEKNGKKIIQETLNGEFVKIWQSAKQIERELGFFQSGISRCCNGDAKQSKGFKWKYLTNLPFTNL
jgi:hypothetical protein